MYVCIGSSGIRISSKPQAMAPIAATCLCFFVNPVIDHVEGEQPGYQGLKSLEMLNESLNILFVELTVVVVVVVRIEMIGGLQALSRGV